MAAKVAWKGAVSLGLINVSVGAIPVAESSEKISFNQIHGQCKAKISQKKVCTACQLEVSGDQIAKGYEYAKGQYVVIPDEAYNALKVESDHQVKLTAFLDGDVDPLLIEKSYYLVPDGKALRPYVTLQQALGIKFGVGTVSMYGKESQCVIQARGRGFVMHTLFTAKEIRQIESLDQFSALAGVTANPQEVKMATRLIEMMEDDVDLAEFTDTRKAALRRMIDDLVEGRQPEIAQAAAPTASTGDLMASLQAMLAAGPQKKGMAKAKMAEKTLAGEKVAPLARAATKTVKTARKKSA